MVGQRLSLPGLLLATAFLPPSAFAAPRPQATHANPYLTYKGAWFSVAYPSGWKVHPVAQSTSSVSGFDSARFTSPDGSAEFYVFSPQWNGDPKEIALDPAREVLVSHRVEHASRDKMSGGGFVSNNVSNWYTARARNNSYLRSWVGVEDKGLNVRHVFGIKYRDQQTYQKYRAQYAHFCKSLEQFSD